MAEEIKAFTKALLDSMLEAASARTNPQCIVVSPYARSVFVVSATAVEEAWNWRRTKRELRRLGLVRKGVRREYHKRVLH